MHIYTDRELAMICVERAHRYMDIEQEATAAEPFTGDIPRMCLYCMELHLIFDIVGSLVWLEELVQESCVPSLALPRFIE